MYICVCVSVHVYACTHIHLPVSHMCACTLMCKHRISISAFNECVLVFCVQCVQGFNVRSCLCLWAHRYAYTCSRSCVRQCAWWPLCWGLMIYDLCCDFHMGHIKLQNSPLLPFFFVQSCLSSITLFIPPPLSVSSGLSSIVNSPPPLSLFLFL